MIGKSILHYKIVQKLGEGGMGEVFLARDTKLDRDVALKFLPEKVRDDAEARERLLREAQAASKLNHANIVAIYAIEKVDEQDFIAMEYVSGRTLGELIEGGLTMPQVIDLAGQIARALSTAHEMGIVHRDIKSDNILVNDKNEIKILDFGLAKLHGSTRITTLGSTMGTMAYMSPEQTQGLDVDHRSDIFSFGVILYEMITGKRPFQGEHGAALTYAICNETPEPLARYKAGVAEDLQRIVDKSLRKDPAVRYQSAADMVADFSQLASGPQPVYAPKKKRSGMGMAIGAIAVVAVLIAAVMFLRNGGGSASAPVPVSERLMLAVMPFENLGSTEDEYFADGMTEEITTHLAKLSGLGVISRTSAMAYKGTTKNTKAIGAELGVDYILEGTIRWDKSGSNHRVRINPQLIRVSDDTHLWVDTYDRVLEQIFSLQTEIAEEVATALNVKLLVPEQQALASWPTDNVEAYQHYLRGKDMYHRSTGIDDRDLATQEFESAVELDPHFAAAHAWLARIYSNNFFNNRNLDDDPLAQAKLHADIAAGKDGSAGHIAMGYYHYYGSRDYESALREFELARKLEPNNSDLLEAMGYVQRRQGDWEGSIASLRQACELDPHSLGIGDEYVGTLERMRRFEEVEEFLDIAEEVHPGFFGIPLHRAVCAMFERGDLAAAQTHLGEAAKTMPPEAMGQLYELIDYFSGDIESALTRRPTPSAYLESEGDSTSYFVNHALYYRLLGDDRYKELAEIAISLLEENIEKDPDSFGDHGSLAVVYACLGDREKVAEHVERATEIMPMSKDAVAGADVRGNAVLAYALLQDRDVVLEELEFMLSVPSYVSRAIARLDPALKFLRDDPEFQRLVAEPRP